MPEDRCGYTHYASRYPDVGAVSCWRPTYGDHDRCLWHADDVSKPPEAFEEVEPRPGERLDGAILRKSAISEHEWPSETTLIEADFEKTYLERATFREADLRGSDFTGASASGADFDGANLGDATFENAKLRTTTFRNAQMEDTEFAGGRINSNTRFGERVTHEEQMWEADDGEEMQAQFDAATWIYRQLQSLSRQNAQFVDVEKYFHREKDLRRRYAWHRGDYLRALRLEGARWLIGYGRNPWRVLLTSAAVVLVSALLYPLLGTLHDTTGTETTTYSLSVPPDGTVGELLTVFGQSLYFSAVTFSTLGFGDIKPTGFGARALAGVESLLGFALVALLISVLLRRGNWL